MTWQASYNNFLPWWTLQGHWMDMATKRLVPFYLRIVMFDAIILRLTLYHTWKLKFQSLSKYQLQNILGSETGHFNACLLQTFTLDPCKISGLSLLRERIASCAVLQLFGWVPHLYYTASVALQRWAIIYCVTRAVSALCARQDPVR